MISYMSVTKHEAERKRRVEGESEERDRQTDSLEEIQLRSVCPSTRNSLPSSRNSLRSLGP